MTQPESKGEFTSRGERLLSARSKVAREVASEEPQMVLRLSLTEKCGEKSTHSATIAQPPAPQTASCLHRTWFQTTASSPS